jgi:CIC family chloride channel protein
LGFAALVGIVAGLGGIAFYIATRVVEHYALGVGAGYYPQPHPGGEPWFAWLAEVKHPFHPWLLLLIPTLGGLVSGLIVFTLAPEAEGHGTDAVIAAYHCRQGQIRPRVPLVKIVASAVTLGTGGSGGREGPIAQIGAGFGSLLANLLRLRPVDRRVLMAAGMGAGIAAIFRAPLAGTMFAAEVLYRSPEFESEVIIPAGIASVVSYCIFGAYTGWEPLFTIPNLVFSGPLELGPYLLLALFMALLALLYTRSFYGCKRLFSRLPIRHHFRPALGAFLTGLVGLLLYFLLGRQQSVLAVLAFGYSALQQAMTQDTNVSAALLLTIALGKILTTSLTIGSGGSGGVFGPSMVIGGCGGGALGMTLHNLWPGLVPHPASFVIVGMAGFFSAAAKTPFSTLIIVSEMTGGYSLLLPSLWVCTLSFILSDEQSIYSSQVESRSRSPAHQGAYVREVLAGVRVNEFLSPQRTTAVLHPGDPLDTVLDRLDAAPHAILPVVDGENRLLGVVNLEEVHIASNEPALKPLILAEDLMRTDVRPLTPDDTLDHAQELFVEDDLLALPVVDNLKQRVVIGMVHRHEIAGVYLRRVQGPVSTD